jgi:hypothetical protein
LITAAVEGTLPKTPGISRLMNGSTEWDKQQKAF